MKVLFALCLLISTSSVFASDDVFVGVASKIVTPPIGVPLAGYGGRHTLPPDIFNKHPYAFWLRASTGVHDPIRSKAMIVQFGSKKVLFLSLDVVGATVDFYEEVSKAARLLNIEDVVVSATHTHSGPGAMSRSWFWKIIATDRFIKPVRDMFLYGVIKSVEEAAANLKPATLYTNTFETDGLQRNRRKRTGYFDPLAHLFLAKSDQDGSWLGGFVNFAVHATALGSDNQLYSADISGVIESTVSELLATNSNQKPMIMHINGAEGDISPTVDGFEGMEEFRKQFNSQVAPHLANLRRIEPSFKIKTLQVKLPKGRLKLKLCKMIGFLGNKISIGLSEKAAPTRAHLSLIQIGDITMATWPGEPTTEMGFKLKSIANSFDKNNFWNLGLSNGYMGYFVSHAEYQAGGYESCSNYHSPAGSEQIVDSYQAMLEDF